MFITRLQRIYHSQHLGGISTGRRGIGHDQSDGLLWVDDEDGADGESYSLLIHIRRILVIQPARARRGITHIVSPCFPRLLTQPP